MDELNDCSHLVMLLALITHGAGGEQHQRWPHALATTINDVFGDLPDKHYVGVQAVADDRIDGLHVRPDQGVELFQCHSEHFSE